MIVAILEVETGWVTLVNAGHPAPLHRRAEGRIETAGEAESGPPVGVDETATYAKTLIQLQLGEALLFVTDGVTESRSRGGQMLDPRRIENALATSRNAPEIIERLLGEIAQHAAGTSANDDICAIALSRHDGSDQTI